MKNVRSPWIRFGCLAIIVLIICLFVFLDPIMRSSIKRDMAGATIREGVATVVVLAIPDRLHTEGPAKPQVVVRFQGQTYPVSNTYTAEALKIDGPARIQYRIGMSGRIIIDSAEPLPVNSSTSH